MTGGGWWCRRKVTSSWAMVDAMRATGAIMMGKASTHEIGIGTTGLNVSAGECLIHEHVSISLAERGLHHDPQGLIDEDGIGMTGHNDVAHSTLFRY